MIAQLAFYAVRWISLLVMLEHVWIGVLEMFLWRTRALRVFKMTPEYAETTAVLAKNQGLYNWLLAFGLFWAQFGGIEFLSRAALFLLMVSVAGIYGGATANRRIFFVQGLPALIGFVLCFVAGLSF
jgi:putative membrane protein